MTLTEEHKEELKQAILHHGLLEVLNTIGNICLDAYNEYANAGQREQATAWRYCGYSCQNAVVAVKSHLKDIHPVKESQ